MEKNKEEKINKTLTRGVDEIIDVTNLTGKLKSGKKLVVKLGIDPTSSNIHLGRSIPLLKLRDFQELGHQVTLIIGDFTGIIGDTSDKESERPMLDAKTIKANMKTYIQQAGKILDTRRCEIKYNSTWLKKIGFLEIAKMANLFGLHEFESRDVISRRMKAGKRVSYLELMYPLLQGYDSVMVKADVELGGTDQRFNLLTGRELQRHYGQEPQDIITNPLIEGTDGRKMSSSWGNTINLLDSADQMFGKTMSLKDEFIIKYFTLITRVPMEKINQIKQMPNPRDQKVLLAKEIVRMYHGPKEAERAEEEFNKIFKNKEMPTDIPIFETDKITYPILDLLFDSKLAESKNDARRVVEGGGVSVKIPNTQLPIPNEKKITNWREEIKIEDGMVVQFGKRKFIRIKKR